MSGRDLGRELGRDLDRVPHDAGLEELLVDTRDAETIYYDEAGRPILFDNCTPGTIISETLRSGFLTHDLARDFWTYR